ncbi:MAG: NrdH-redoxin [Patescibacteria group bacterium]|jgi:glutaredoxin-like YruB-family protein|nr:NrdH-redoxin [Patescibacteria group bacterium]
MDKPNVTTYTTTWCSFCHAAKDYLNKIGVKYEDKDVEKDIEAGKEAFTKSGQRGIPVIDIAGDIIVGFDRPRIDQSLKEHKLV